MFPMETTIDSVGRIVVPKPLRDALGLTPGSTVDISRYGAGLLTPGDRSTRRRVRGIGRDRRYRHRRRDRLRPDRRWTPLTTLGPDTSVAVPLLIQTHQAHATVVDWWGGRDVAPSGHAVAETYSVLTRLPGDLRLAPPDAANLIAQRFIKPLVLRADAAARVPSTLSRFGIGGGAVYDALVALAAVEHGARLATRDCEPRPPTKRSAQTSSSCPAECRAANRSHDTSPHGARVEMTAVYQRGHEHAFAGAGALSSDRRSTRSTPTQMSVEIRTDGSESSGLFGSGISSAAHSPVERKDRRRVVERDVARAVDAAVEVEDTVDSERQALAAGERQGSPRARTKTRFHFCAGITTVVPGWLSGADSVTGGGTGPTRFYR
jgi:AbrB family looped-hinge helix DNA binding protein